MAKVKICGNTNFEDVKLAVSLGADYLGFIFAESKRKVMPEQAEALMAVVPDFKNFVGVFVNHPKKDVEKIAKSLNIHTLQFHGDETALYCRHFIDQGFQVIKTFRIQDAMSLKRIDEYNVTAFLFDTYHQETAGGTGKTFDWKLIENRPYVHEKLFLAGGLNPDNLADALRKVNPFAVDVASGVEKSPGKKDPEILKRFIQIAKGDRASHAAENPLRP